MRSWFILGLVGIVINESANYISGKPVNIDGKKLMQYILMLAAGPATTIYAIYKFFNASPVVIKAEEEENEEEEDNKAADVPPEQKKENEG